MVTHTADMASISPLRRFSRGALVPLYHSDTVNHCPACSRTSWHIGRSTAECAFCATALPLAMVAAQPMAPRFWTQISRTASRAAGTA